MAALLATAKTVDVAAVVDGVAVNVPLDKTRKAAPKGQPQTARPSKQRRQVRAAAKIKAKADVNHNCEQGVEHCFEA